LSSTHSAAGVMLRPSSTARAIERYAASSTFSLPRRRARSERRKPGWRVMVWALARLWACCSSRSMLNISSRRICSLFQCEPTEILSKSPLR